MKQWDEIFNFKGFGNCDSSCRLRIYEGHGLHKRDMIVIASQLHDHPNPGTSVTNAAEIIANAVLDRFPHPSTSDGLGVQIGRVVWIEHYPEIVGVRHLHRQETFDRVSFAHVYCGYQGIGHGAKERQRVICASAHWNHINREIVAQLIGEQP